MSHLGERGVSGEGNSPKVSFSLLTDMFSREKLQTTFKIVVFTVILFPQIPISFLKLQHFHL